ncbi:hypothetical protein MJO29_014821 [Puccinia striiformis f. sp. tritici]|nr:hypothetical protein MJO29_014821 [Puccinia striiformis f. sp. tritici]
MIRRRCRDFVRTNTPPVMSDFCCPPVFRKWGGTYRLGCMIHAKLERLQGREIFGPFRYGKVIRGGGIVG